MMLRRFKDSLRPEEIITIPFLALMIFLYAYLPVKMNFNRLFVFWLVVIVGIYAVMVALAYLAKSFRKQSSSIYPGNSGRNVLGFARDWLPIIAIICIYENLHDVIPYLNRRDRDAELLRLDSILFGEPHITVKLQSSIHPLLTDWMNFAYSSLFLYLPILGCVLYFSGRQKAWRLLLLAFTITAFAGFTGYALVPAVGPLYAISGEYTRGLDGRYLTPIIQPFINNLSISRDVFPSLHVAYSTVFLLIAYRFSKGCFFIFLPLIISLWVSTLYLRYHYVIDLIAGFALALFSLVLSEIIHQRWYEQ